MAIRPNDRDGATVDQPPDRKGEINMVYDILPLTSSTTRDLLLSRQRVWRGQSHAPVLPGPCQFLNRCAPHDIAHHIFHLTRLLVTARYLEDRLQSLFDCYRICLRNKRRAETEASNARGERNVAHAALQLISGQSKTSENSVVAQLQAEL